MGASENLPRNPAPPGTPAAAPELLAPELLAPAGGPEAAHAAFQYGADAVYCGLKRFSARAEAANFSLEELADLLGYARTLAPRRRVFVTLNTATLAGELPDLLRLLARLAELAPDAIIVQDLGLVRLVRRHFPGLTLHGSTQMAVHSLEGAKTARELGLGRINLARELTLAEIRAIAAGAGLETEVFIHGALCYSYSGLCLLSSHLYGRSGNRGRCAYPCRDRYAFGPEAECGGEARLPFSMMDLAQGDAIADLRAAGVAALKIEGRMKSPLYVAAVTHHYRRLLDGKLRTPRERAAAEEDLRTIFSRPQTSLHLHGRRREGLIDPAMAGHRGARIGEVAQASRLPGGRLRLTFATTRELERHDGIQLDVAVAGRPFGFAFDEFRLPGHPPAGHVVPPGATVEVVLPPGAPEVPPGTAVYCASSQRVKREFAVSSPKPGEHRLRHPIAVAVRLRHDGLEALARLLPAATTTGTPPATATSFLPGDFTPARDPAATSAAVRAGFERLGDTPFRLDTLDLDNPAGLFAPASALNRLRRDLAAKLAAAWDKALDDRAAEILRSEVADSAPPPATTAAAATTPEWLLFIDRPETVAEFAPADWDACAELVVALDALPESGLDKQLCGLRNLAAGRLRLALPPVTRAWEAEGLRRRIACARQLGFGRWQVANLAGWHFLGDSLAAATTLDLAADWFIPTFNPLAIRQLRAMGARHVTLSPEDGAGNLHGLLRHFADSATVIVYQDTPLFISEACPWAAVKGRCAGQGCAGATREASLVSEKGGRYLLRTVGCRSVLMSRRPFCLQAHLDELRAMGARRFRCDLAYRGYEPAAAARLWRDLRAGRAVANSHAGNWFRGLE